MPHDDTRLRIGMLDDAEREIAISLLQEVLQVQEGPAIKFAITSNLDRFNESFFDLVSELCEKAQIEREQTRATLRSLSWLIGEALFTQGLEAYHAHELPTAVRQWEQAIPAYREAMSQQGIANCWGNLGVAHELRGDYGQALDCLQRALDIDVTENNREGQIERLNNLGSLLVEQGQIKEGIEKCQQALSLAQELGNPRAEAAALNNLALAHQERGELQETLRLLQRAITIDRANSNNRGLAKRLGNLGQLYQILGLSDVAMAHYQQALDLCDELDDAWGKVEQLNNVGLLQFLSSDLHAALANLNNGLSLSNGRIKTNSHNQTRRAERTSP